MAGKPQYSKDDKQKVIDYHLEGLSAAAIFAKLDKTIPQRTIGSFIQEYKHEQSIIESVKRVFDSKVVDIQYEAILKSIQSRKIWLMEQAMEIWSKLEPDERVNSRLLIKFLELAQKDDELLLKPLMLNQDIDKPTSQSDTQKALEDKLGLLDGPAS